jgi:Domain of unknown function (DUF7008)/Eco57I restriction-modification methylase
MIDRKALLADLQSLLRKLEADLLERSESREAPAEIGEYLCTEHKKARDADRTAQNFEDWRSDFITQVAAAWVLSCVFARFLEDNGLVDPPKLSGPGERLQRVRDEHEVYFHSHPTETDREYLLDVFDGLSKLPGASEIFGEHNPIHELRNWLSGDAAAELLRFFQKIDANTGDLVHDFADPEWNTRFLGDLYQDLSEAARKKYALLQTPDFVEALILDRTLEPALDEFGLTPPAVRNEDDDEIAPAGFRMIDPACGSGHFLLGGFKRVLGRWRKQAPGAKDRELVQRALNTIVGVDVNPFAIAIARFRLLLAALKESAIWRLADAPNFQFHLASGDSLLHGVPGSQSVMSFHELAHHYATEDAAELHRVLQPGIYNAVVGNPPYIAVSDAALRAAYRDRFPACYKQLALTVPFFQRMFMLAIRSVTSSEMSGFVGMITGSAFSKQQFGKKLVEEYIPRIDLTALIDTAGAYIPGHGTPTIIIFGRNRLPRTTLIRAVMGKMGEPATPADPARGKVWSAIISQFDAPGSESDYISVADVSSTRFYEHPWSLSSARAAQLYEMIEERRTAQLRERAVEMGRATNLGEDEIWLHDHASARRCGVLDQTIGLVIGECIRHWVIAEMPRAIYPYQSLGGGPISDDEQVVTHYLWPFRTTLSNRKIFGLPMAAKGHPWYAHLEHYPKKLRAGMKITFASVATHNQFAYPNGECSFKQSAPVIALSNDVSQAAADEILTILNSSAACFWFKQTLFNKGSTVDQHGARQRTMPFEDFFDFAVTHVGNCPLFDGIDGDYGATLDKMAREQARLLSNSGGFVQRISKDCQVRLEAMHALQEELDWHVYYKIGLTQDDLAYADDVPPIALGERAFEIVMARRIAAGDLATTWFDRHGSTPITELPEQWPSGYRRLVKRRIELIEANHNIGLIEQPEHKRRWNTEAWDSMEGRAFRGWLLDRLESYFDFDGRMNDEGTQTAKLDNAVVSLARLADIAQADEQFHQVGVLLTDDPAFNVLDLVAELVHGDSVPLLPVHRYKPSGLRKRAEWERTWEFQRAEDAIDARTELPDGDPQRLTTDKAKQLKKEHVGDIPVPPRYTSADLISAGGARYWSLRGKLDVAKERWVSLPDCEGEDGTLAIAWAGYGHLQLAKAVSAYYVDIQERVGGSDDPRLVPLLACLLELLPWLKQWHNEIDPEFNVPMGDYFEGFINDEARQMGKTLDKIRAWEPPKRTRRKKKTKKKAARQTQTAEDTDA